MLNYFEKGDLWADWYYLDDKLDAHPCKNMEDMMRIRTDRTLRLDGIGEIRVSTISSD